MMKQYEVIIKYTAFKKVLVCGKDEGIAHDQAMYIAKCTNWTDPDQYEISAQSITEVTSGE